MVLVSPCRTLKNPLCLVWTPGSEVNSKFKNQSWYYGHKNKYRLLFEEGIANLCSLAEMSIIAITLRRPTAAGAASGFVSEKQKEF